MSRTTVTGFYPKPHVVNALSDASLKALQNAISSNASLADRHNAFVDYCTALLFCCTGHRAVREPFSELRHFELDLGLLLICDKVSDDSRAWRLVALPDMAAQQVKIYSDYLRLLASKLGAKAPMSGLASQIWMLAEGGTPMPLFFYLRESEDDWDPVTPSVLALRWQDRWRIPINLLRHVTADTLLHASQRADWVSIQLGHTDGVDHPLGSTSTSPVLETLAKIRPFLNEGLKSAGWTVVPSPLDGARVRHRPEIPSKTAAAEKSVFGAQRREAERNQKKSTATQLFRALWQERFPSGSPLDVDAVQQIVEQIIAEAPNRGVSVNWGLQLLYRYLRTRSGGLATLRRVSRVRLIDVEPSPFNADTLESYQATQRARIAFTGYLTEQGKKGAQPDFHVRVAEIVVSAALFGGLANAARLKCLGDVVHGNTYRLHGHEFVDLPLGQGAVFRWFPDQVSQRLIHGLFRAAAPGLVIRKAALEKAIKSVIGEIGSAIKCPFEWLAKSSRAAAVLEIPGFVASCLSGDVPAVSLPLPQWVRVVTGRALVPDEALPEISNANLELWSPSTSQARKQRHTEGESRAFLYELRGLISKARHAERAGNLSARKRSKRMLSDLLQKASIDSGWSALPVMLAAWTVHLCQHGTRSKRDLAFATVEKYAVLVSSRLLPVSTHLDVGSLDEVAYEELYLRAVEREKPERRFELACRLSEMHAFWREAYLLEDLDWSAIMAAAGGVAQSGFADANLVTSAEYRRALAVITAEATLGDRRRWQYAGLLIFGFRFGLRFGEALRLAYTDVQRDGECVYVWVHNAVYGEVKSPAGVRVLLLTERLDPLEQQVLDRLLAAGEADFSENPGAMLMADRSGKQDLLDRAEAGRLLNELLRRVTGDRCTRFHHLRHGWVTRAVAAQAVLPIPGFSEHLSDKAETELFGDAAGFPLRSIAVAAGHASERTTLGSYTHCVDQLASLYLTVPQLSDHAKAYAEQVASATIRTRRRATRRSSEGRLPPIPEPPIATQLPQDVTIADMLGSLPDMRRPSLIDVDMLLRRFRSSSGQPIEVVAENLGLDRSASRRILRKAQDVELRTGYDGYRLASRADDPLALASSSQQVDQYRRETDALSIRLMEIQKRFSVMTASEQTVLVDALAVWVETANAAQWTCDVMQGEQLRAITYLARFMGAEIVATLPTKTDIESVHMLLRSYGISWNVRGTSQFSGIGLKLSNLEGPNRTLWRELLVMAATLGLDN